MKSSEHSAIVLVLGDIGRSPRMQYHCLSLLKHNYKVKIISYKQTAPLKSLSENKRVSFIYLKQPNQLAKINSKFEYLYKGIQRVVEQITELFLIFLSLKKSKIIIVQNPPSIPTLFIVQIYTLMTGTRLIIDWHNFGYSIINLNRGPGLFVTIAKM
jgi:beta-1,4-mannosyltransferase